MGLGEKGGVPTANQTEDVVVPNEWKWQAYLHGKLLCGTHAGGCFVGRFLQSRSLQCNSTPDGFLGGAKRGLASCTPSPYSLRGKSSDCSGPVRGGGAEPKNHCHVNDTGGRPPRLILAFPTNGCSMLAMDSDLLLGDVVRRFGPVCAWSKTTSTAGPSAGQSPNVSEKIKL